MRVLAILFTINCHAIAAFDFVFFIVLYTNEVSFTFGIRITITITLTQWEILHWRSIVASQEERTIKALSTVICPRKSIP